MVKRKKADTLMDKLKKRGLHPMRIDPPEEDFRRLTALLKQYRIISTEKRLAEIILGGILQMQNPTELIDTFIQAAQPAK